MKRFSIVLIALVITGSYSIVFLPQPAARELLHEDGPIEQATMCFFLMACACLIQAWRMYGAQPAKLGAGHGRRVVYLLLAVLMFICAGEEISWGQRIFGWGTPEGWSEMNAQAETNLHNLTVIEGGVRDPETQTLLHSLTNANRLFAMFWLAVFVAIPVLDRVSGGVRRLLLAVGMPVVPLWIGALFVLNHAVFFIANRHLDAIGPFTTDAFPLDELKEHNYALVYAAVGFAAWMRARVRASSEALVPHRA